MTGLTIANDSLARASLSAAYEVDARSRGVGGRPEIFHSLRSLLSEASGIPEPSGAALLHSDPQTTEVLAKAVEDYSQEPVNDISKLADVLEKIIEPLKDGGEELSFEQLQSIKSFCLSLHRALTAVEFPIIFEWENKNNGETAFCRS